MADSVAILHRRQIAWFDSKHGSFDGVVSILMIWLLCVLRKNATKFEDDNKIICLNIF